MAQAALVHDWLVVEGGAERVTLELARLLPGAPVYTSFYDEPTFGDRLPGARVRPWPLQRLFGPSRHFRSFLPAYPLYFGGLDLRRHELVVSSSVAFAHAVRTAPEAMHISYVHTPMRYAWDLETYLRSSSFSLPARVGGRVLRPLLQGWDRTTARRPNVVLANSETVRRRINRLWGRDAEVIYPPVDVEGIQPSDRDDGYMLIAARMLAYRRLDLAVQAANKLDRELILVGEGPERKRLEALAGPTVRFMDRVSRHVLVELMRRCHAYLVPGIEDFGIAPVEAMAAGKPVVAFGRGGAAESVIDGRTGVLFDEQSPESFADAIDRLDTTTFDQSVIRSRAEEFGTSVFLAKWRALFQRLGVQPDLYSLAPPPVHSSGTKPERTGTTLSP
jgi:glycosyltransferase involved in cell wall biosynthesis